MSQMKSHSDASDPGEWISLSEAGRRLGATTRIARKYVEKKMLRTLNLNHGGTRPTYRVSSVDVEELMQKQRVGETTSAPVRKKTTRKKTARGKTARRKKTRKWARSR